MSTSTGVNTMSAGYFHSKDQVTFTDFRATEKVLRYSALVFGVFYGFSHQASLTAAQKIAHLNQEYERKANLISQAKAEYTKSRMPAEKKTEGGGVISDPDDKNFDLEAYLTMKMADESKK
ncbi:MAG: hypothetical protein M1827_006938 [Pycnora praestabilis]|nr:MAG: hypothetical protein M1827_006938 [Pycnora praestabilis]